MNRYAYARNNPLAFVGPTGAAIELIGSGSDREAALALLQGGVGDAGEFLFINELEIVEAISCATSAGIVVNKYYRPNEDNNRYAHCLASCLIEKTCPGGGGTAWVAGFGKELVDVARCLGGRRASCDSAFEDQDSIHKQVREGLSAETRLFWLV